MIVSVSVRVPIAAAPERVFSAMVDLESQDRWILGTRLYALGGDVQVPAVGSRMAALSGVLGIGVLDVMEVTHYEPPHRWETRHVGHAFRGRGVFQVEPDGAGSIAVWVEEVELPALVGRLGWPLARPVVRFGLHRSLLRLAKGVLSGSLPPRRSGPAAPGGPSGTGRPPTRAADASTTDADAGRTNDPEPGPDRR